MKAPAPVVHGPNEFDSGKANDLLPAIGKIGDIGDMVPVPDTLCGGQGGEAIALFNFSEFDIFGALGGNVAKEDGKIIAARIGVDLEENAENETAIFSPKA